MKRIPLILSLALLLLLPAIALYPIFHASAEKNGVDRTTDGDGSGGSSGGGSDGAV